jgi:phosphatidylinositol alpha-1,6-mannosyltransferase
LAGSGRIDTTFHAQWQTLPGALMLRKLGMLKRVFVAAHGRELLLSPFAGSPALQRVYDAQRRRWIQAADGVFPVSHFTAGLLEQLGVSAARTRVVSNGTDPEFFRPLPAAEMRERLGVGERRVLLSAGRLTKRKGLDQVISMLPKIADQVPDVLFLIIGEGEERESLAAQARDTGVSERVRFLGQVPFAELPQYYAVADVFVTPCRDVGPSVEGFGLVFLEANACGKPVLAGRSGGTSDALDDGETGFLINPEDGGELLARAVQLLTDPELRRRMGDAGRRRVLARGSWDHTSTRLVSAMRELAP